MLTSKVVPIERLELRFEPWLWPFAFERRAEIEAHFEGLRREQPAIWNGRVLMLREHTIDGGVLRGTCFETDFASFLVWRELGFPDAAVKNFFAMGAVRSRDGAFVLGVMAPYTSNPGAIYFPSGTPEPDDLKGDEVDLDGSLWREMAEETGLREDELSPEPGWLAVDAGPRFALIRMLHTRRTGDDIAAQIRGYLAREPSPELSDVRIVRGRADFDPMMPPFIKAFLTAMGL